MNFGWLVGNIDTSTDFWVLGIGALLLPLLALVLLVARGRAAGGSRRPARPDPVRRRGRGPLRESGTASAGSTGFGSRWRCEEQYLVPSSASR